MSLVATIVDYLRRGGELTATELATLTGANPATCRWALRQAAAEHPQIRRRPEDWNQGNGKPRMGAPRVSYFWLPE